MRFDGHASFLYSCSDWCTVKWRELKNVDSSWIWTRTFGIPVRRSTFWAVDSMWTRQLNRKSCGPVSRRCEFKSRSSQPFAVDFGCVRLSWRELDTILKTKQWWLWRLKSFLFSTFRISWSHQIFDYNFKIAITWRVKIISIFGVTIPFYIIKTLSGYRNYYIPYPILFVVSASIWEGQQCKRVELTLLDMSSAIINKMVCQVSSVSLFFSQYVGSFA